MGFMGMMFPDVQGSNLQGRRFNLPKDLAGSFNIVIIAFKQNQQLDANTWLPHVHRLTRQHAQVRYYELPTLRRMSRMRRTMLDMSMRMGVTDKRTRASTITLYVNKTAFKAALGIPHEEAITILLLNKAGDVLWRVMGPYNKAKGASLAATLQQVAPFDDEPVRMPSMMTAAR